MSDEMETPCYVIESNGFRDSVSYKDDWCYGRSEFLGTTATGARELIKEDIRRHFSKRNRIPIYYVSDHGNVSRARRITLRKAKG